MAKQPPVLFDNLAAAFADYGTSVRGYVRYHVVQHNLAPFLPKNKTATVLDIGGGGGADTAWLAERGQTVTFIEPSVVQRRLAERRFNFMLTKEIRDRITINAGTLTDLPPGIQFDLVVMHTVAQYQSEPLAFIQSVLPYVKPGGTISILEKGHYGAETRLIRTHRHRELPRLRRTGYFTGSLKEKIYAFKPEQIEKVLLQENFEVIEWSGVRVLSDDFYMPVQSMPSAELKVLLDAEVTQGRNPNIRGQGQLLHFIARRTATNLQ